MWGRKQILLGVLLGAVCLVIVWRQRQIHETDVGFVLPERESVVFGLPSQPSSALAFIALERGYFEDAGLDVEVVPHVSGKRALAALLEGRHDVVTAAEVPVVFQSMQRADFRILAQIAATDQAASVVANRESGITAIEDLRGKRIGTQRASAVHFYLHMFLIKHGMRETDVSLVFMKAEKLPDALKSGTIDAMCMREPYVSRAKAALGENAVVFDKDGIYFRTEHLVGTEALVQDRPHVVRALLTALVRAEVFAATQPDALVGILSRQLGILSDEADGFKARYDLRVSLDQALLFALEDEAAWVMKYGLVEDTRMPNFLDIISLEGLEQVKPEAVTLLH